MRSSRYSASRQKACDNCSNAKAKCDRRPGGCARCAHRGVICTYPRLLNSPSSRHQRSSLDRDFELSGPGSDVQDAAQVATPYTFDSSQIIGDATFADPDSVSKGAGSDAGVRVAPVAETGSELDFSDLELVCPINVAGIANRWLNPYIPVLGQKPKQYPENITTFIYRILQSYIAVTIRGRGIPPFVHASQLSAAPVSTSQPLSICFSLVRICDSPLPGAEATASEVLEREMTRLFESRTTYTDMGLLAAFQAYLIYAMVLFFRLGPPGRSSFLRQAIMNMQELACESSRGGLVCAAEARHARPKWEAWIASEAKRRTLFTMYLFDSVLSAHDGLPTFLGTELQGLPAPAGKSLWQATDRRSWEVAFNIHLADWTRGGGGLRIDELWPSPPDMDERAIEERRRRVDQWLEDVEEFGTMLYAVTSCTHGA